MEDKIINPLTKKYIKVGGPTYYKLIDEGYKESYLMSLKTKNDLQLSNITNEPVQFNDDVMNIILRSLDIRELFAMYHTNKYIVKSLNNKQLLSDLAEQFEIEPTDTFYDFIISIINDYLKTDITNLNKKYYSNNVHIFLELKIIKDAFINNHEKITMCRTRRLDKNKLCLAKYYLLKNGFGKEIELLNSSKNDDEYKKNLYHLEYKMYDYILSLI